MKGLILEHCDPQTKKISFSEFDPFKSRPTFTIPLDDVEEMLEQHWWYDSLEIDNPKERFEPSDALEMINELIEITDVFKKLESQISDDRQEELLDISGTYFETLELHDKIKTMQADYREVLCGVTKGKQLCQIAPLNRSLQKYNDMQTNKLVFSDVNSLIPTPLIKVDSYGGMSAIHKWNKALTDDLTYVLVEYFKLEDGCKYIRKCQYCDKYYISKTKRMSKYCSDRCRLDFHNRKRIESGEAREYKRKKRQEGAKESYYG